MTVYVLYGGHDDADSWWTFSFRSVHATAEGAEAAFRAAWKGAPHRSELFYEGGVCVVPPCQDCGAEYEIGEGPCLARPRIHHGPVPSAEDREHDAVVEPAELGP